MIHFDIMIGDQLAFILGESVPVTMPETLHQHIARPQCQATAPFNNLHTLDFNRH